MMRLSCARMNPGERRTISPRIDFSPAARSSAIGRTSQENLYLDLGGPTTGDHSGRLPRWEWRDVVTCPLPLSPGQGEGFLFLSLLTDPPHDILLGWFEPIGRIDPEPPG